MQGHRRFARRDADQHYNWRHNIQQDHEKVWQMCLHFYRTRLLYWQQEKIKGFKRQYKCNASSHSKQSKGSRFILNNTCHLSTINLHSPFNKERKVPPMFLNNPLYKYE